MDGRSNCMQPCHTWSSCKVHGEDCFEQGRTHTPSFQYCCSWCILPAASAVFNSVRALSKCLRLLAWQCRCWFCLSWKESLLEIVTEIERDLEVRLDLLSIRVCLNMLHPTSKWRCAHPFEQVSASHQMLTVGHCLPI